MRSQPVGSRVERLEKRVAMLEQLPLRIEKIELQIVQLRSEMRDEFSAVRQEMRTLGSALREEIRATDQNTLEKLTEAIEAGRREARVLFEELVGRIATIGEGKNGGKKRRPKA